MIQLSLVIHGKYSRITALMEMESEQGRDHPWSVTHELAEDESTLCASYSYWEEFLLAKTAALKQCRFEGYRTCFMVRTDEISFEANPALLKMLVDSDVGISFWYDKRVPKKIGSGGIQFVMPNPVYNGQSDEENFFRWLRDIRAVQDFSFVKGGILISTLDPELDVTSLNALNSLFDRYNLNKNCLGSLMPDGTPGWLRERIKPEQE